MLAAALVVVCLGTAAQAEAREVRVAWKRVDPAKAAEAKDKGLRQAFVEAVAQEAAPLLGESFDEARLAYLKEYINMQAASLISGYNEIQFIETRTESIMLVDATVDKAGVQRLAQRVLSASPKTSVSARVDSQGLSKEEEQRLALLRKLCGIEQSQDAPLLVSVRRESGAWSGKLAPSDGSIPGVEEAAGDLDALWFGLWAKYASQGAMGTPPAVSQPSEQPQGQEQGQPPSATIYGAGQDPTNILVPEKAELELLVQGWTMPDGVYALDRAFREWKTEVGGATLKTIEMKGGGVVGVWRVTALDKAGFVARVQQYCAEKGLQHSFVEE
jgi:hypothetical protein